MIKLLPLLNEIRINVSKENLLKLWHETFDELQLKYNNYPEDKWYNSEEYQGLWHLLYQYGYSSTNGELFSDWLDTVQDKWLQIYSDIAKFRRENK